MMQLALYNVSILWRISRYFSLNNIMANFNILLNIELNMVYLVGIKYNSVYTISAQRRIPEIIL